MGAIKEVLVRINLFLIRLLQERESTLERKCLVEGREGISKG